MTNKKARAAKKGGEDKSTNVETEHRISAVIQMLLAGMKRRDILQNTTKNGEFNWNVQPRQIDTYIARASEEIQAQFEADKEKLTRQTAAKYDFIYKQLIAEKKDNRA